jgi:serine/threonine-protein kinase HipA
MSMPEIKYCPCTLAEGYNTYSPTCLRRVFNEKRVSHVLPYLPAKESEEDAEKFIENRKRISISGVQEKLSFLLEKNLLRLTQQGEQGTYIFKPIPRDVKKTEFVPANEHLTMQIARQVYNIYTAENALIFFKNGSPAYITKRFDVKPNGTKYGKEDFASLSGKTKDTAGSDYKYTGSYEEAAALIKKYVPAWQVEVEKFFEQVLFNYLFSNGDAHLKNFSLLETVNGDYFLSPAYDLINTWIHVDDTDFALEDGLFIDNFKSETCGKYGHPGKADFMEFGKRIGIMEKRMDKLIAPFLNKQPKVYELTDHSYLDDATKRVYKLHYETRKNSLNK